MEFTAPASFAISSGKTTRWDRLFVSVKDLSGFFEVFQIAVDLCQL